MLVNPVDVVGNFQRGFQFGTAQKEQRRIESERSQLKNLAPRVLQGDAAAFNEAAAINPEAATELQDASDRQYRRLGNVIGIMRQALDSGKPELVQRAHQTITPFLQEMSGGRPVPPQWDDSMLPAFEQIEQRVKMAQAGNSLATPELKTFNAMTAGLSPDDVMKARRVNLGLDPRAVTGAPKVGTITGADGRERPYQYDPATQSYVVFDGGQWVPLGGAPQAAPATAPGRPTTQAEDEQFVRQMQAFTQQLQQAGFTPEQIRAAQLAQEQVMNSAAGVAQVTTPAAGLAVGRSPEEQAALTTQATEQAKLDALPAELNLRTDAAVNEAVRKAEEEARIKREADLASAEQKKYVDAATTIGLLDEAEQLVRQSTGSRAGAAWDEIMATFGKSTAGAQAIAALNPIAAKLTLAVPRMEGPQSDADRLLYQKAAGDLANPNLPAATRLAAMGTMRSLATKYRDSGGKPPAPSSQPRRIQNASDYNSLPAGALYIAPDGTTRRKK